MITTVGSYFISALRASEISSSIQSYPVEFASFLCRFGNRESVERTVRFAISLISQERKLVPIDRDATEGRKYQDAFSARVDYLSSVRSNN